MGLFMTADIQFPWCGINKMYSYLYLSVLLAYTLKCVHPAFPREQAVKDPDGDLANRVLPAICLLLYGAVYSCYFHNRRLTNLLLFQNKEDDGQVCHFMS